MIRRGYGEDSRYTPEISWWEGEFDIITEVEAAVLLVAHRMAKA